MHEFVMKIGYGVWNFFASMDVSALGTALRIMGVGMLGIFIVTGVIILVVNLLDKIFSR